MSPGDGGGDPFSIGGLATGFMGSGLDGPFLPSLDVFRGALEWLVPGFALTVPGLLIVLAVTLQAVGAVAWLPVVRRTLGAFGLRRRASGRR